MANGTKRLLALLLALMMCVSLLPVTALAEGEDENVGTIALVEDEAPAEPAAGEGVIAPAPAEDVGDGVLDVPHEIVTADERQAVNASGQCGDDLTWNLEDGVLTISGTGDMWDFTYHYEDGYLVSTEPWDGYGVLRLVISEGVTGIGRNAFYGCGSLSDVTIPASVTTIRYSAFTYSGDVKDVHYGGTTAQWNALSIEGGNSVFQTATIHCVDGDIDNSNKCGDDLTWTLENGVLTITGTGDMWDYGWSWSGNQRTTVPWGASVAQIRSLVVSEGVTALGQCAFAYCGSLSDVTIPASVTRIRDFAFGYCSTYTSSSNLKDVYYGGTVADWRALSIGWNGNDYLKAANIHCADGEIDNSNRCGEHLTWTLADGVLTISGTGETWDIFPGLWYDLREQITRIIVEEGVTGVNRYSFNGLYRVSSVSLPQSLTAIRQDAFSDMRSLETLELPEGLKTFEHEVFSGAGLRKMKLPAFLTTVPAHTFAGCRNLTEVELPEGLTAIEIGAFRDAVSLNRIAIPAGVTRIGSLAFDGCTALHEVYYGGTMDAWKAININDYGNARLQAALIHCVDGDIYNSHKCGDDLIWTLDNGVLTVSGTGDMWGFTVDDVPWYEDRNTIKSVVLEDGVTNIQRYAFASCNNLSSVTIPASVACIWDHAFYNCSVLEEVYYGGTVADWNGLEIDSDNAPLQRAAIHCTDGNIDNLHNCGDALTWTLEDGVLTISGTGDMWDFEWNYDIGRSTAPWGASTSQIRKLVVSAGVTGIGNEAFDPCDSLTEVDLPDTLVRIGVYALQGGAFTEIRLPTSLKTVDEGAFYQCNALTDIYYGGTVEQWGQIAIGNNNSPLIRSATIHCADGDADNSDRCGEKLTWSFDEANGTLTVSGTGEMWSFYSEPAPWDGLMGQIRKVVLEPGVTSVGQSAFWGCPNLKEISFPEGLTALGQFCFRECPALTVVELPASLETMEQGEFSECPNLTAINVAEGGSFRTVNGVLFTADMKTLVEFPGGLGGVYQVPEGVTTLGHRAFYGCGKLTEIKLPASVVEFGWNEFQRCYNLEAVNIPYGVQTLHVSTFWDCTSLKRLTIPASVTLITDYAFRNCTSLKTICFEGSAPEIQWYGGVGENLFYGVTATAYYPADDETWTEEVRQSYGGDLTWVAYTGQPMINVFTDVQEGKYYYEPVLWAYYHDPQITSGTSETTFGPNETCTRGQVATFLWRAAGEPAPSSTTNPFKDVKEKQYYYKPVLWAYEAGITSGTTATTFDPNGGCTRAQVVTFLWRFAGSPEPETSTNPFTDVKAKSFYYKAVLWAVENGITAGTSKTTFDPNATCTRAQVVTFLYRYMGD